jgi:hypothetical protein
MKKSLIPAVIVVAASSAPTFAADVDAHVFVAT